MVRCIQWAALVAGVLFLVSILCLVVYLNREPSRQRLFDTNTWKSSAELRNSMTRDLRRHVLKPSMTYEDIVELLGKPDQELDSANVYKAPSGAARYLYYDLRLEPNDFDARRFVIVLDYQSRYLQSSTLSN